MIILDNSVTGWINGEYRELTKEEIIKELQVSNIRCYALYNTINNYFEEIFNAFGVPEEYLNGRYEAISEIKNRLNKVMYFK
jgi:hypothetical protein